MSNSKLVDKFIQAHSNNYTKNRASRGYSKITEICIHHVADVVTIEQLGKIWQNPDRKGSSTYGVGNDGRIGQYVNESDIAWCNSNWASNCRSVSIETSNSKTGDDWLVSDKALESLIKLVADVAKRNGMGKLVKGKNLTWHSMYANTSCPGNYLKSKLDYIVTKANEINESADLELKIAKIEKKSVVLNTNADLWNLEFKSYSDAKSVKKYKSGDIIHNIVAIAEHPLGSKYYMTEYSYNNNVKNGFNIVDCDDYVEVKVEKPAENEQKVEKEEVKEEIVVENEEIIDTNREDSNALLYVIDKIIQFFKKVIGLWKKK